MTVATIIQTIQVILAPVVMVTGCAILLAGVHARYQVINDRLRAMSRERLDLFHRPDKNTLEPPDQSDRYSVERLAQIDAQIPNLLRRHQLVRDAVLAIYGAVALFILCMFAIAAASAFQIVALAWVALVIFLMGTGALLAGVAVITLEVRLSDAALRYEVDRVMKLGR